MIKNQTITHKIIEKTNGDTAMREFLIDIVNYENESSQYKKEYQKLIDKAVEKKRGVH